MLVHSFARIGLAWVLTGALAFSTSGCLQAAGGSANIDAATAAATSGSASSAATPSTGAATSSSSSSSSSSASSTSSSGASSSASSSAAASNAAPTISGVAATSVVVGSSYSFTPVASDPDGDALGFSIVNKPAWAVFNTQTGALTGVPTTTGSSNNIVITVSDGAAAASLATFSINVTAATGSVTLSWTIPTLNEDGSVLSDLIGHKIYYGTDAANLTQEVSINSNTIDTYTISGLTKGVTYFFGVAALNSAGVESELSAIASTTI
jgi:Putative Ig domain